MHAMICRTEGIQSTAPVRWRSYDGMCAVYWEAAGDAGASGYYLSPDPRIMLFFNEVSQAIRLSEHEGLSTLHWRPMLRALYVPARVPIWTQFDAPHVFSHLDIHLNRQWLLDRLTPIMGRNQAESAMQRPAEIADVGPLAGVARCLADEVDTPTRSDRFAESLAVSLVTGIIDDQPAETAADMVQGGLTPHQMRKLRQMREDSQGRRLSNAELSAAVGLSEGWFSHAFKKSTGKTPLQWQQDHRIVMVKKLLQQDDLTIAEIATRFDFADQSHLTRVFRRYEGTTPSAWRRIAQTS